MIIAGIIAEYNPFHCGHAFHVERTRALSDCDYVVACMAGHFTQRGEPTPWSKWARARMALSSGVDAVFELPGWFAVRTADAFARGGVAILGGIGADVLSFGSETDDMSLLESLADFGLQEPTSVSDAIREKLAAGMSHAKARGEAIGQALGVPPEAVNRPNTILAAEYLRTIKAQGLAMRPLAVRRAGEYHSRALGSLASASAIRSAIARGEADAALDALPEAARPFAAPDQLHPMDDMLLMRLREMPVEALAALPDVSEGLEMRLHRCCRESATREALLMAMKCKRYTHARLSRLLSHALLGFTQEALDACPMPPYARLLGVRAGSEALLTELKRRATLPVVASPSALRGDPCFESECRATDLWALLHDDPALRLPGRELTEKFIRL